MQSDKRSAEREGSERARTVLPGAAERCHEMDSDTEEIRRLAVRIVEEHEAAAVTPGVVVQRLAVEYDREHGYSEVFDLLHELEDEGELVYHLGEYNEFAAPE